MTSSPDRRRGPRARTGPGRATDAARSRAARVAAAAAAATPDERTGPRSRMTSRAAVLVLVVAVLVVSYASSMKAFLQQRAHINDLQSQIAEREAAIDSLEAEKRRWSDEAYVEQQARARLGYVKPGEKTYLVLDENGEALKPASDLDDPSTTIRSEDAAWWSDAWSSVELAGNPPKPQKPPATSIDGSDEKTELGD